MPMRLLLAFAALCLTGLILAQTETDPDPVVVIVNGEAIRESEYFRRMEHLNGVGKLIGNGFVEFPPGLLTIEQLVVERLMRQLAEQHGVTPTRAEIQQEIQDRAQENPNLIADWEKAGFKREMLEEQIFLELLEFKILTRGITITNQEIDEFYNDPENRVMFVRPARAKLRIIAVANRDAATRADAELREGKPFSDVARTHSIDVSRSIGGEFGTMPYDSMPPVVRSAVQPLAVGATTDWLNFGENLVKFLKESAMPESVAPLDAALRRSIRRKMMIDRGRVRHDIIQEVNEIRSKAQIEVRRAAFAEPWRRLNQDHLRSQGMSGGG